MTRSSARSADLLLSFGAGDLAAPAGPRDACRAIVPGDLDPCQPSLSPRRLGDAPPRSRAPALPDAGGQRARAERRRSARRRAESGACRTGQLPTRRPRGSSRPRPRPRPRPAASMPSRRPPRRRSRRRKRGSAPPTPGCNWRPPMSPRTGSSSRPSSSPSPRCLPGSRPWRAGRRLLVLADRGGTDELVKVRLLLDATLPVIRSRTGRLSAELAQGRAAAAGGACRARRARPQPRQSRRAPAVLCRARAEGGAAGARVGGAGAWHQRRRHRRRRGRRAAARRAGEQPVDPRRRGAARAREDAAPLSPFAPEGAGAASAVRLSASRRRAGHRRARLGQRQRRALARPDARDASRRARSPRPADGIVKFAGRSATMTACSSSTMAAAG